MDGAVRLAQTFLAGVPNVFGAAAPGMEESIAAGSVEMIARTLARQLPVAGEGVITIMGVSVASFTAVELARHVNGWGQVRVGIVDPPLHAHLLADPAEALFAPHSRWPRPGQSRLADELVAWKATRHGSLAARMAACDDVLTRNQAELLEIARANAPALEGVSPRIVQRSKADWMAHLLLAEAYSLSPMPHPTRALMRESSAEEESRLKSVLPDIAFRQVDEPHAQLISYSPHLRFPLWLPDAQDTGASRKPSAP